MRISTLRKNLQKKQHPVDLVGGVFPKGYYTIIASKAGVGKTWLMLKIACELSVGGNVFSGLSVDEKPRKVIIFSGETGAEMLENRLNSTDWDFEGNNVVIYSLFECMSSGVSLLLNTPEGQQNIDTIIRNEVPDIVFFDTLISFHSSDENSQKDMSLIYSYIGKLANTYKVSIVLMHHLRKSPAGKKEKNDQDEIIGTSTTNRLAGVLFTITRQNNDDVFPVNTVTNVKNWNAQIPTFNYKIVVKGNKVDVVYDFSPQMDLTIRQRISNFVKIMQVEREYKTSEIAEILKMSSRLLREHLKEYVNNGILELKSFYNVGSFPESNIYIKH